MASCSYRIFVAFNFFVSESFHAGSFWWQESNDAVKIAVAYASFYHSPCNVICCLPDADVMVLRFVASTSFYDGFCLKSKT